MPKDRPPRLWELPPEEHAIGIYLALVLGGVVLAIGTLIIFMDLLVLFQEKGFVFTPLLTFRILLLVISAYASMGCFTALFRMINLQRMQVKKVDREFRDFVMYARPLVEEVIKQRIIGERITERLDHFDRRTGAVSDVGVGIIESAGPQTSSWGGFLVMVALLGNITVAIFLYLLQFPWSYVPYSIILLAFAWWIVMANFFRLLHDIRSYYLPAAFILIIPSLSMLLRGYMLDFQMISLVFLLVVFYIIAMYAHYSYLTTGKIPDFLPGLSTFRLPAKAMSKKKEVPSKLKRFLPSDEKEEFDDEY